MRLFTYMDHLNGTCKAHEIETPWESRWTSSDVALGLCADSDVGTAKPAETQSDETQSDETPWTVDVVRSELSAYLADKAGYRAKSGSNLNRLMEYSERIQAQQAMEQRTLSSMAANKLGSLSTMELMTMFLKPILALPDEHREAVLASWGCSLEDLAAFFAEVQAGEA